MDDIKLYAPPRRSMNQLLQIVQNFYEDIHMSFGLDKCQILDINSTTNAQTLEKQTDGQAAEIQEMEPHEMYRYLGTEQNRNTEHKSHEGKTHKKVHAENRDNIEEWTECQKCY